MKQRILFVCLGNICRSPAAEAVLKMLIEREALSDDIYVDSAGTYGGHAGERSDARMRRAAAARGIEMPHLARQVRFREYLRRHSDWSYIPDPYYEGHEGFELVLDLLEDGCATLIEELKAEA